MKYLLISDVWNVMIYSTLIMENVSREIITILISVSSWIDLVIVVPFVAMLDMSLGVLKTIYWTQQSLISLNSVCLLSNH